MQPSNNVLRLSIRGQIRNLGQQNLNVLTDAGDKMSTAFKIAEATRPLSSVSQTCVKNSVVLFGRKGGVIKHMETGNVIPFERGGGFYELSLWLN